MLCVYRLHTSGLPLWREPSDHPDQPHIVALAALLVDEDDRSVKSFLDYIVRPDGWTIPEETTAIHGVTTEHALEAGSPESGVLREFVNLWRQATRRISYNERFDSRVVRVGLKRELQDNALAEEWKAGAAVCLGELVRDHLGTPGRRPPKLSEVHSQIVGSEFDDDGTPMADVRGCLDVYFAIQEQAEADA